MPNFVDIFDLHPLTTNDIIIFVTAIFIWLTLRATKKANQLQTSPALIINFKDANRRGYSGNHDGTITVRNIGKGPAYDVNFLPFVLYNSTKDKHFTYTFYLDDRFLGPTDEQELKMWVATSNGVEASGVSTLLSRLIPLTLEQKKHLQIQVETPALFVANYRSLENKKYHSVYRLYSVLPPVGDIVMQLLHHGAGFRGQLHVRWYHLIKKTIRHEGNKKPAESRLVCFFASLHKLVYRNR